MLNIDSIQNGIVIDHIQAGKGMRIYELLELDKLDCCVALIKNARSSKLGRKDIIKIEGDLAINFDVLGFIDNNITVCTIKNGELVNEREHRAATSHQKCCKVQKPAPAHKHGGKPRPDLRAVR